MTHFNKITGIRMTTCGKNCFHRDMPNRNNNQVLIVKSDTVENNKQNPTLKKSKHQGTKRTIFSEQCIEVMDFFLKNSGQYYTPLTASLSMKKPHASIKDCMNLLKANSYLSKLSDGGSVYFVSDSNMEFWHTDFKNHILRTQ